MARHAVRLLGQPGRHRARALRLHAALASDCRRALVHAVHRSLSQRRQSCRLPRGRGARAAARRARGGRAHAQRHDDARHRGVHRLRLSIVIPLVLRLARRLGRGGRRAHGAGGDHRVAACNAIAPRTRRWRDLHGRGRRHRGIGHARAVAAAPGPGRDLARPRHCLPHTDLDRLARLAERDEAGGDVTQPAPHARDPWFVCALRRVRTQRRRAGAAHGLSG